MFSIPQSTSFVFVFKAYLSSDHVSEATGKTIAITISKAGGAFGNPNAGATNATEISSGWYKVTLDTTDTATLGIIAIRGTAGTIDDVGDRLFVVSASTGGLTNLDAAISSRMATYTQPTGFLAATFPSGTVASTTNITDGTIATVTNLTNSPTSGDFTATMKASLNSATPAVTVSDKKGFSLTHSFPSNFSSLGIGAGVHILNVDTLTTYTGNTLQTGDAYARLGAPAGASVSADIAAVKTVDDAVKAKTDNLPSDPADASDIAAAFSTVNSTLATIAGYVDTEVAAIKAKTDNLPASPAATGDAMALTGAYDAAKTAAQAGDAMALTTGERTSVGTAVWATATRLLTAATNLVLAKGTGITGFNDPTVAAVADEVETRTLDANITKVNSVAVTGVGSTGSPWRPA